MTGKLLIRWEFGWRVVFAQLGSIPIQLLNVVSKIPILVSLLIWVPQFVVELVDLLLINNRVRLRSIVEGEVVYSILVNLAVLLVLLHISFIDLIANCLGFHFDYFLLAASASHLNY